MKKPICLVRIDPTATVRRLKKKANEICSKGKSECRFSNRRVTDQLKKLSGMSPRFDETIDIQMFGGGSATPNLATLPPSSHRGASKNQHRSLSKQQKQTSMTVGSRMSNQRNTIIG